jgi:hypothetical protein
MQAFKRALIFLLFLFFWTAALIFLILFVLVIVMVPEHLALWLRLTRYSSKIIRDSRSEIRDSIYEACITTKEMISIFPLSIFIYMYQHSSSSYICSKYLSVDPILSRSDLHSKLHNIHSLVGKTTCRLSNGPLFSYFSFFFWTAALIFLIKASKS